ncbi:MAG: hypothetical protein NC395_05235 [Prevotella sp.]|nr:hypothetical protein [Prevotella sp.]
MGFIETAAVETSEELAGIWSDFIDISKFAAKSRIYAVRKKITDGTRVFLKSGQSLVMMSDGKISDYISGAGAFVFHSAFEPFKYTGKSGGHYGAVYGEHPEFFGGYSENAACYLLNMPERIKLPFEFSAAAYYDKVCGFDVFLQGGGYFYIGTANALSCFVRSGTDCEKFAGAGVPNISDEEKESLSANFGEILKSAFLSMRGLDIEYGKLIYSTDKIIPSINADPQIKRYLKNGEEISDIEFTSIFPDEDSVKKIVKARRENG